MHCTLSLKSPVLHTVSYRKSFPEIILHCSHYVDSISDFHQLLLLELSFFRTRSIICSRMEITRALSKSVLSL